MSEAVLSTSQETAWGYCTIIGITTHNCSILAVSVLSGLAPENMSMSFVLKLLLKYQQTIGSRVTLS